MMNQGDLFRKLGSILNELNDQYEYLAQNPQQFNELELELFLANANFLAEHIQIIRKLNINIPKELPEYTMQSENELLESEEAGEETDIPEPLLLEQEREPSVEPVVKQEPVSQHKEESFKPEPEPLSFEFILNERPQAESAELPHIEATDDQVRHEDIHPAANLNLSDVEAEHSEVLLFDGQDQGNKQNERVGEIGSEPFLVIKEEDQVQPPTHSLIADKVEDKVVKPTLNDLLANSRKKENVDTSAVVGPPITDLKQAINLNDKLLYIKDLFNGYNLAYSEAIDLINKMPDFKTADTFLKNNYAVKNNWAAKQATVEKFYNLLRRRF